MEEIALPKNIKEEWTALGIREEGKRVGVAILEKDGDNLKTHIIWD